METTNSVEFRVPDFLGEDGVEYTDIEIAILSDDGDNTGRRSACGNAGASTECRQ
jgi:hypothetical protein